MGKSEPIISLWSSGNISFQNQELCCRVADLSMEETDFLCWLMVFMARPKFFKLWQDDE